MITVLAANLIIFLVCIFGLLFAAYNAWWVSKIVLHPIKLEKKKKDLESTNKEKLLEDEEDNEEEEEVQKECVDLIKEIGSHISTVNQILIYLY